MAGEETSTSISRKKLSCNVCSQVFQSRTALFRHIRNSACALVDVDFKGSQRTMQKNSVAISIGYDAYISRKEIPDERVCYNTAEIVESLIRDAFCYALNTMFEHEIKSASEKHLATDEQITPVISSSSHSAATNVRHMSLSEENGVGSIGTVITLSYTYPVRRSLLEEKVKFQLQEKERILQKLVDLCQDYIDRNGNIETLPLAATLSQIEILAAQNLQTNLHAESDCTQRIYHYLLPLNWLNGGEEVGEWWLGDLQQQSSTSQKHFRDGHGIEGLARSKVQPPNDILRSLKSTLRSAESKNRIGRTAKEEEILATGRFGVLAYRARRAFHNFTDPSLGGDASPSHKPVWRVLDRVRILQKIPFTDKSESTQVVMVIAFSGDDFLPQQVRRIIGSAVAMSNGWLPSDFIDIATSPDMLIETPLAPENYMYSAGSKYHFFDQKNQEKSLFGGGHQTKDKFIDNINRKILERATSPKEIAERSIWLLDLQNNICPRINKQLDQNDLLKSTDHMSKELLEDSISIEAPPTEYEMCLNELRSIVTSGRWPLTSVARSKVIKQGSTHGPAKDMSKEFKDEFENTIQSGSFTIINPEFCNEDGDYMLQNENIRSPQGNTLFPDLVKMIFDLEVNISKDLDSSTQRPASSHCAVNRNAQFTPHVDSGRGLGQSLSMIVGLGDYGGGMLLVEGDAHDIRYTPLQFDGWRSRHWTAPFVGERFSLVWFTPDI